MSSTTTHKETRHRYTQYSTILTPGGSPFPVDQQICPLREQAYCEASLSVGSGMETERGIKWEKKLKQKLHITDYHSGRRNLKSGVVTSIAALKFNVSMCEHMRILYGLT